MKELLTELRNKVLYLRNTEELSVKGELILLHKLNALEKQLAISGVVKSLKDEDIPTFDDYTQNYGYKRIGNSNVYKNEGTYKDRETLLKEYKKEYCL